MSIKRLTFPKSEKLKSRKLIEHLFKTGKLVKVYPVQLVFTETEYTHVPFQVGFSVPKKRVKLAVNRNRIKRLMRESYRLNKHLLCKNTTDEIAKKYVVMFIYTASELPDFETVNRLMVKTLLKLKSEI